MEPISRIAELRVFGERVQADSARSLDLLRTIESTLEGLCLERDLMVSTSRYFDATIAWVNERSGSQLLDPENSVCPVLELAQQAVDRVYERLVSRRDAARQDHRLHEEDGLEDEFNTAIAAAADLHNSLNTLRWAIMEHDADLDQSGRDRAFDNVDDLVADLKSA